MLGRFTGQGRLLGTQQRGAEQPQVRCHPVALRDLEQVAGNDRRGRDLDPGAVTAHTRGLGDQFGQRGDRPARAELLREADERVQDHDRQHDQAVVELAERERQSTRGQQRPDQRRAELVDEQPRGDGPPAWGSALGPKRRSRASASAALRPSGALSSSSSTSFAGVAWHARSLTPRTVRATLPPAIRPCPAHGSVEARISLRETRDGAGPSRAYGHLMAPIIVVGIEDSFRAEDAVALAGDLARAAGAEVLALSAFSFDDRPSEHYNLAVREPLREAAELTLEVLCEPLSDLPVRRLAVADPSPARALIRAATESGAELIVVGSSHGRFTGRVRPGSTGRRLLKGAPCPVALAPQGHRMRPHLTWGRVTVGIDGRQGMHAALSAAAAIATATGRRLRVVRVFEPVPDFLLMTPDAQDAAEEELRRATADVPGAEPGFVVGDPAVELARESDVSDLLVIGSRADGFHDTVGVGELGEQLLRAARCPVLIVPAGRSAPFSELFSRGKVLIGSRD